MVKKATDKITIVILILYFIAFAANFAYMVDWSEVLLPTRVTLCYGTNNEHPLPEGEISIYRDFSGYYMTWDDPARDEKIELSYTEYRYCMGVTENFAENNGFYPRKYESDANVAKVKYLFSEKEYEFNHLSSMTKRIQSMYACHKSKGLVSDLHMNIGAVLDKYNVKSANVFLCGEKERVVEHYGFLEDNSNLVEVYPCVIIREEDPEPTNDRRLNRINNKLLARCTNIRLWERGYTRFFFPNSNIALTEMISKSSSGKTVDEISPDPNKQGNSRYGKIRTDLIDFLFSSLSRDKEKNKMSSQTSKFVKTVYLNGIPKGERSLYSMAISSEDLTVMILRDEEENIKGYIEFESSDTLTRQMMLAEIRLVFLTNGHLPILQESYYVVHFLFIAFIQNIFLAAFLIIAEARKR
ncbi:MAG: hypothetical protein J6U54_13895 [Clostridiales bacterium]|nr:hypothetical protein [Clostridiales bacterium]